ncbi:MAG: ABC transporter substrate-binding protein [Alphaproteobacteria bacterium]|nr:ABC transporter substrate-binding protein [Alphaproteobacteria bacterium]
MPLRQASGQSPPLKIGLILPTSGPQAQIGQACRRGADVANDVFADMKIPAQVEIVAFDTETKPEVARTQADKAVDAGMHVLVGAFDSGQTIAVAQVAEQRGIPLVVNIAAAPPITESGYKFIVRNFPTAPMLLGGGFAIQKEIFARSGTAPKSAVVLSTNDTFGTAMIGGIKAMFPKLDMPYQLADIITYDPAAKDLSVEVAKAKATKADLLLPICKVDDGKLMIQELVKQRWEPMIINPGGPGTYERDFIRGLGKYGEFIVTVAPWMNPKTAMTQSLEKHHSARFPSEQFDLDAGFTFEAVLIAATAWLKAQSTNPEALMAALRATHIDEHVMIGGPIQFDAKGQNVGIKVAALENFKRAPVVVLPEEAAVADLVFPPPPWGDKRRA